MRVLLIEDDGIVVQSMEKMLHDRGFNVFSTGLGEEGLDLGRHYDYDIIIMDLHLPDMDGMDVLRALRRAGVETPVFILSGNASPETKVEALRQGADDYMTKPFHRDELTARLHAVVRRSRAHSRSVITTGKIALDLDSKTVSVNGAPVHLTTKEYEMLELFSLRKGMMLTKDMILNQLYGGMDEPNGKIVDVFICKLRRKLELESGSDGYIRTVWGRGYEMRDPVGRQRTAA